MSIGSFAKYFHDEFSFAWRKIEEHINSFATESRPWCDSDVMLQKRGLLSLRGMARHLPSAATGEMLAMLAEYEALLPGINDSIAVNLQSCLDVLQSLHLCLSKHLDEMEASEKTPALDVAKKSQDSDGRVLKFIVGDRLVDWSVASDGPQQIDSSSTQNIPEDKEPKALEATMIPVDPRVLGVEFMARIFDQTEIWPVSANSLQVVKQKLMNLKEIENDKKLAQVMLEEIVRDFGRLEQRFPCQTILRPFRQPDSAVIYEMGTMHFSLVDEHCSLPKEAVGNLLRGLASMASYLPPSMNKCMFQLAPHFGKRGYVADLFCDEIGFFHWKQACKNLDNSKFGWEIVVLEEKCFFRIYLDESVSKRSAFLVKSNDPHFKGLWAIPSAAVKRFMVLGKSAQTRVQGLKEIKKLPGHNSVGSTISLAIQWKGEDFYLEAQDILGEELITVGSENSSYAPYTWGLSESGRQVIWFDLDIFLNFEIKKSEAA